MGTMDGSAGPSAVDPAHRTMRSPAECRAWLEQNLGAVREIVGRVCRRGGVCASDQGDFTSAVFLKLVDRDYAVLRQFDGRSRLNTFLHSVIRRYLLDWRDARWGRWRASACARQMGTAAVELERLIARDGVPGALAIEMIAGEARWGLSGAEVSDLQSRLPLRCNHRREEPWTGQDEYPSRERADHLVERRDQTRQAERVRTALMRALSTLPGDDRRLLRLRFHNGLSVADVAAIMGMDAKRAYRRYAAILRAVRIKLEESALSRTDISPLIGDAEVTVPAWLWMHDADAMIAERAISLHGPRY